MIRNRRRFVDLTMNNMKEKLPREVKRGTVELAPGVEAEVVYLDNGESGYTERGMKTYDDWLQSKSMRHRFERLWKSLIQKSKS